MPENRKIEIRNQIKDILGVKKLHKSRLQKLLNLEVKYSNKTHGEIVVSKIEDIRGFMTSWRKHFIENNDCKFLPKNWSIE